MNFLFFPKLLHAYQNSKFLAVINITYFKLMHNMLMIVFCAVLLQMHYTYGMRWEKVIQIETRCCNWSRNVLRSIDARRTMLTTLMHDSIRILQMQKLSFQHFSLLWENPQFIYYGLTMYSCFLHNLIKVASKLEITR